MKRFSTMPRYFSNMTVVAELRNFGRQKLVVAELLNLGRQKLVELLDNHPQEQRESVLANDYDIGTLAAILISLPHGEFSTIKDLEEIANQISDVDFDPFYYPDIANSLCRTLWALGVQESTTDILLGVQIKVAVGKGPATPINRNVLFDWIILLGARIEIRIQNEPREFTPDFDFGDNVIQIVFLDGTKFHELAVWTGGSLVCTYGGLSWIGFTSAGISSGSLAASLMSSAAIANGGGVVAGSFVSICQSAMAGTFLTSPVGIAAAAVETVGYFAYKSLK